MQGAAIERFADRNSGPSLRACVVHRIFVFMLIGANALHATTAAHAGSATSVTLRNTPPSTTQWYGWKVIITDSLAAGCFALAWYKKDWAWFGGGMTMFLFGGPTVHAFHEPDHIRASAQIRLETLAGGAALAGGLHERAGLSLGPSLWIIAGAVAIGSVSDIIGSSRTFPITPGVAWLAHNPVLTLSTAVQF